MYLTHTFIHLCVFLQPNQVNKVEIDLFVSGISIKSYEWLCIHIFKRDRTSVQLLMSVSNKYLLFIDFFKFHFDRGMQTQAVLAGY